jgi:glycine/D-amino acid oxidase-like deaminating enzyme
VRARPDVQLTLLEKESRIARHQTGRNSGVLHSGIYYQPGSRKALTCVEGRRAMERYCSEHDVPFERCGKVIVAVDERELPRLEQLEVRARANGVRAERIGPERLREIEPHSAGIAALHVPETGIVDFSRVANALADAVELGLVEEPVPIGRFVASPIVLPGTLLDVGGSTVVAETVYGRGYAVGAFEFGGMLGVQPVGGLLPTSQVSFLRETGMASYDAAHPIFQATIPTAPATAKANYTPLSIVVNVDLQLGVTVPSITN